MEISKQQVQELIDHVDVEIDGDRPWDIQIHDDRLYSRVLREGSLGFGEAYMDGWWDVEQLDEFAYRMFDSGIREQLSGDWKTRLFVWYQTVFNPQTVASSYEVGEQHYDRGNELYRAMLDDRTVYTCGYYRDADDLEQAQEDKLDLVCQKLKLEPGMKLLDIGCGWGSFMEYALKHYDVEAHGVTVSEEQAQFARGRLDEFEDRSRVLLTDYRDLDGTYDRIVSLGMFEHVGYQNYRTYMEVVNDCLTTDGLFLLDSIGNEQSVRSGDPWFEKYIFPNSMLPSASQVTDAAEDYFILEDWHNFGGDYDRTLMEWYENFDNSWDELSDRYDDRFYRMWEYYLLVSAGGFRARTFQNWQIVFSSDGVPGGYQSVR